MSWTSDTYFLLHQRLSVNLRYLEGFNKSILYSLTRIKFLPLFENARILQCICYHKIPDSYSVSFGCCRNKIKIIFMKSFETLVTEILEKCFIVIRKSESNLLRLRNNYFLIVKIWKLYAFCYNCNTYIKTQKSETKQS